ncbi:hypothetical protein ACFE04_017865 [Oxalis oulophora]
MSKGESKSLLNKLSNDGDDDDYKSRRRCHMQRLNSYAPTLNDSADIQPSVPQIFNWQTEPVDNANNQIVDTNIDLRGSNAKDEIGTHAPHLPSLEIYLMMVLANKETTPTLKDPLISVPAKLTIDDLYKYVSQHSPFATDGVEILVVKPEINLGEGAYLSLSKDNLKLLEGGHRNLDDVLDGPTLWRNEYCFDVI